MYDALAGCHAGAHTLEDFGLLSLQRPVREKDASQKSKAKPAGMLQLESAVKKIRKPR
jgi:hypothetical protein